MGSEFGAQTGNRIFAGIDCVWRGDKEKSAFCKAAQMCVETAGNQPLGQCPQATAAPLGPAWRESLCVGVFTVIIWHSDVHGAETVPEMHV